MRPRVWVSLLTCAIACAASPAAFGPSARAAVAPSTRRTQPPPSSQTQPAPSTPRGGLEWGSVLSSVLTAAQRAGTKGPVGGAKPPGGGPSPTPSGYGPTPPSPPPGFAALPIAWTAAVEARRSPVNERGQGVAGKFVAGNRAAIDGLSLPVLLPGDPDLVANMRLFAHGDFYTVSSTSNGMSFVLTGQAKAFMLSPGAAKRLPGGRLSAAVPSDGIVIEGNDSGLDADLSRFGASYNIALQCAKQKADPRCASETYVRGVIARMTVVLPRAQ